MSAGHTPGPLTVGEDPLGGDYMVCVILPSKSGSYGTEIARCDHNWNEATAGDHRISWKEAECNARLFAAAPELLSALNGVIDILGRAESNASGNPEWDYVGPRVAAARAAIAKATGQ